MSLISGQVSVVPTWFALGLAFDGVLDQYGGLSSRLGADSVGDVTPPRSAFVAGGNSKGGMLAPNESELRGSVTVKELRRVLENRKQAAFDLLSNRDSKDAQRKSAKAGDEVVFFNFRDAKGSEADGSLHFGAYLGQDVSALVGAGVGLDLALVQRSLFTLVAGELADLEKGAALAQVLAALPSSSELFEDLLKQETGVTPSDLERAVMEKIKKS